MRQLSIDDIRTTAEKLARRVSGPNVLAIVPDNTRSGGVVVGQVLRVLASEVYDKPGRKLTVLIALGTHGPLDDAAIRKYLGLSATELSQVEFVNHEWKDPSKLRHVHTLSRDEMLNLSGGTFDLKTVRLEAGVPVDVNYRIVEADDVVIIGPTLPHEVVGCSGGVKYFYPGCSGPRITGVTHWLGAGVTIPNIIGVKDTPVRRTMDFLTQKLIAGGRPNLHCFSFVPRGKDVYGAFVGDPWEAYSQAADLTLEVNVTWVDRLYDRVIGLGSPKYPEIWTAGKISYKSQTIVKPGGDLIMVGRHITHVSDSWGPEIERVGYHCLPYIEANMGTYLDEGISLGVLAHVTHVYGTGSYVDGVETPTINVRLASSLTAEHCARINLPFVDVDSLDLDALRADPNTLVIDDAGEVLYRYRQAATKAA